MAKNQNLRPCKDCGHPISMDLVQACPSCGARNDPHLLSAMDCVYLIIIIAFLIYAFGGHKWV